MTRLSVAAIAVLTAGTVASSPRAQTAGPLTIWNQAYQENYERDSIADILAQAEGAYVLLDPFDPQEVEDWAAVVAALHARGNQVAAYISIGTGEDWRADFETLRPSLVARQWDDWGGEYFVNMPDANVLAVMKARIDRLAGYGFDWVEFDNMDWTQDDDYRAGYGFAATAAEGTAYYQELCAHAQSLGVRCMAKSTVEDAGMFDGVTYESYTDDMGWWDQDGAKGFLAAGKPVIIVHYDDPDCAAALAHYIGIYGPAVSFLCETESAGGYVRLLR